MKKLLHFLQGHSILVGIIVIAATLRTYSLYSHGILFPDAAHDLLTAHQNLENHTFPLLGIPSSRPWLHQGPITIWIEMAVMAIFGTSTFAQSCIFALIGVGAAIALYELVTIHIHKHAAYVAVAIFAAMPLAVAHARVPYHTTPIPLVTVAFLWSLVALWQKFTLKRLAVAVGAGVLLIQFELSNLPLLFLLPFVFWKKRQKPNIKQLGIALVVLAIGFLPQLLAAMTTNTSFLKTVEQKATSQTIASVAERSNIFGKVAGTVSNFWLYGGRMFSVDVTVIKILALVIVLAVFVKILQIHLKSKLPVVVELTSVASVVITVAYFFVGSPSEAYFPPYFIFVPLLMGYIFTLLPKKFKRITVAGILIWMLINCVTIFNANFFVMNKTSFQYDSVGEHRLIVKYLSLRSNGADYMIDSLSMPARVHPNFLDHIRWLAVEEGKNLPGTIGKRYLIEGTDQPIPPQAIEAKHFITKNVFFVPNTSY